MEVAHIQSYARQLYEAQGAKAIAEPLRRLPPLNGAGRAIKHSGAALILPARTAGELSDHQGNVR